MERKEFLAYESPRVEVINVQVEQGFAVSDVFNPETGGEAGGIINPMPIG